MTWRALGRKNIMPTKPLILLLSLGCVEAKGSLPQDGSLWQEHYFELKVIKTQ